MKCMGVEHAAAALEGADCTHREHFTMKRLCSWLFHFSAEGRRVSEPQDSGPAAVGAAGRLRSCGFRKDLKGEPEMNAVLSLALSSGSDSPVPGFGACEATSPSLTQAQDQTGDSGALPLIVLMYTLNML